MELTFIPLENNYYPALLPYFLFRPTECSESHFLYHIIWEYYYDTKFCMIPKGIFWLQNIGNYKYTTLVPISKKEDLKSNFELLQDYFTNTLHTKLIMFLVDEEALETILPDPNKYRIKEDIDSFDYIYEAEKLKNLSGKNYHKKKNHINAFIKEYGDCYEYKKLTEEHAIDIIDFSNTWLQSKEDDQFKRLKSEEIGLKNLLDNYSLLDVSMGGIYIHNKLEAFTIGTYDAHNKMAVIHIEKANIKYRGLYPFINQQFLLHEFIDAILINREDDMGIPSLRKAKEAYYPIKMAKKYTIYEK